MNRKPFQIVILSALFLVLITPEIVCAKWGSRSSSRSRSSSSSYSSRRSTSSRSSWGSSSQKKTSWGSSSSRSSSGSSSSPFRSSTYKTTVVPTRASKSVTPSKNLSAADKAAFQKSRQTNSFNKNPPSYSNTAEAKKAAINDFKQKHASEFNTTFATKPATRPDYVPQTTRVDGRNYEVHYHVHNGVGGYYYQNSLGQWVLYSVMADALMRDRYMSRYGYDYTGNYYVRHNTYHRVPRRKSSWGWVWFALILILVVVGIAIGLHYYSVWKEKKEREGRQQQVKQQHAKKEAKRLTGDPFTANYWKNLRVRDIVTVKDQQTIEALMLRQGSGFASGLDLRVKVKHVITEQSRLMYWYWYDLEWDEGMENRHLFVKIVDDEFDARITFEPADFPQGSRYDLLDQGHEWLFQPPEDEDNYNPEDLSFTTEIVQTLDDQEIVYRIKPQGTLFGEMTSTPKQSGIRDPQFVTIVEYSSEQDCPSPELILLEIGSARGDGFIMLLQGRNVSPHEIEVTPAT